MWKSSSSSPSSSFSKSCWQHHRQRSRCQSYWWNQSFIFSYRRKNLESSFNCYRRTNGWNLLAIFVFFSISDVKKRWSSSSVGVFSSVSDSVSIDLLTVVVLKRDGDCSDRKRNCSKSWWMFKFVYFFLFSRKFLYLPFKNINPKNRGPWVGPPWPTQSWSASHRFCAAGHPAAGELLRTRDAPLQYHCMQTPVKKTEKI